MQPAELRREADLVAGGDLHLGGHAGDGEAFGAGARFQQDFRAELFDDFDMGRRDADKPVFPPCAIRRDSCTVAVCLNLIGIMGVASEASQSASCRRAANWRPPILTGLIDKVCTQTLNEPVAGAG